MRPISTVASTAAYSGDAQKRREELDLQDGDGSGGASTQRRGAQRTSVGAKISELDSLLTTSWDPTGKWNSYDSEKKAERLRAAVGTGYEDATLSLINQTGQYCAYCDSPLYSGLRAEPMLPANWFPAKAFDYDQQLLICAPCREAKQRNLSRASGAADVLANPNTLAWPHLFAQTLTDGALLPFRYDLVSLNWNSGIASGPRPIDEPRIKELLKFYRRGYVYVQVERSDDFPTGIVQVQPPGLDVPFSIAVWLSPTSTNRAIEKGVRKIIDVLELNVPSVGVHVPKGLDRRLQLRTMAYLKALDLCDRMVTVYARGDADLLNRMRELWKHTIRATGFWGVWLSVFRADPGIQQLLAQLMPGSFNRQWAL